MTAQGIDKHTTIQYLIGSDTDYIAFGNDHNDIHMLDNASKVILWLMRWLNISHFENPNIKVIDNSNDAICKVLDNF